MVDIKDALKIENCVLVKCNHDFKGDLVIPNGVKAIGDSAFYGCNAMTSINIPDSVTKIGKYAFYGCCALISINIPDSITEIEIGVFSGCSALTSINIPNSVTKIDSGAFDDCRALTTINIPDSVMEIGGWAFNGCERLQFNEYDNAYYLGSRENQCVVLFKAVSADITSCNINTNCNLIYEDAFRGCCSLSAINIPDSVIKIGQRAFDGCSALTSINIPNSVTKIESYVFNGCSALNSINIPDSVTEIGNSAFSRCERLHFNEYDNAYYLGNKENRCVVLFKAVSTDITSCNINTKCNLIYEEAFSGCSGLATINIPDSVVKIGEEAFSGCCALTSISIPNSVKSIESGTFWQCSGLTSINIPDSVTKIGSGAFIGCSSLASINIPNSVTSIESDTFGNCSGLTSVIIPDSVTEIGPGAFEGCRSLTSINIPKSVKRIDEKAFKGCPKKILKKVVPPVCKVELPCGEVLFHCYKNGYEEGFDFYGVWDCVDKDAVEIVDKKVIDISVYKEVRMITFSDNIVHWETTKDVPCNYIVKARLVTYILPDNTTLEFIEPIDEVLDWSTFECENGVSWIDIDYNSITALGSKPIEEECRIEDDDDWDWYAQKKSQ